jgi:hypothetical protein
VSEDEEGALFDKHGGDIIRIPLVIADECYLN